ncbi:hypothetical protein Pse7367_2048 [Thalassoporum mexicanum PCC 7367]|uniref:hypothetical protein n=1 Tax=Thalassoporum mexicanum TaxID=3457544 RepID=UPI00029FACA6|nr:hypothetical protein [Pseudanabaena sp. PCC 7367]AFY70317.1 hypothetical protein Pse7367_2048 [Pseudanabaena sp. PCC 7367]
MKTQATIAESPKASIELPIDSLVFNGVLFLLPIFIGIFSWLLLRYINSLDQQDKKQTARLDAFEQDIQNIEKSLLETRADAAEKYVHKVDWVREMEKLEATLEKVLDRQNDLNDKFDHYVRK